MPIYEVECQDCGRVSEVLVLGVDRTPACPACGSPDTRRLISPTSSLTGHQPRALPGPGDTTCCGRAPAEGSCAGPGSCCGKV